MLKQLLIISSLFLIFSIKAQEHDPIPIISKTFTIKEKSYRRFKIINPNQLEIHWQNKENQAYSYMPNLVKDLKQHNKTPIFMINGGIYTKNKNPAGLYIEKGNKKHAINQRKGQGNFHIMPNGVFYILDGIPYIKTTADYLKQTNLDTKEKSMSLAIQSGPMIIINGKINPKFTEKSKSYYIRNAVCLTEDGSLYFWINNNAQNSVSTMYEFAKAGISFGCKNALYLDGNISKVYFKGEDTTYHLRPFVSIISLSITS